MAMAGINAGETMRNLIAALLAACIVASPNGAQAIGCLTGAAAGAVAGHYAGHHAVLGAMAGCAAGHHIHKMQERKLEQQQEPAPGGSTD
jgi:hypothetical protein